MILLKSLGLSVGNNKQSPSPSAALLRPTMTNNNNNNNSSSKSTTPPRSCGDGFDSHNSPPSLAQFPPLAPVFSVHPNEEPGTDNSSTTTSPIYRVVQTVPASTAVVPVQQANIARSNSTTFKLPAKLTRSHHKQDWIRMECRSPLPEPRSGHSAVAVENTNRMYVFGGYSNRHWYNDLWELDLNMWTWTKIDAPDPKPCERLAHSMSIRKSTKIYIFGGWDEHDRQLNDLWEFDIELKRWREIIPKSDEIPQPRFRHITEFYERKQRLFVFGGYNWTQHSMLNDLYEFDFESETWHQIAVHQQLSEQLESQGGAADSSHTCICPRERHASAIDEENGKMYIMGGYGGFNSTTSANRKFFNDLWEFDLECYSWRQIRCTGDIPRGVRSHTLILDCISHARRLILFAGRCSDDCDTNDLFECNLETFKWKRIGDPDRGGNVPCIRGRHTAIMCSGDFVIFGGTHNRIWFNDTYFCSFGSYRRDLMSLWQEG